MAIGTRGCATGDSGEEDRSCNLDGQRLGRMERDGWAIPLRMTRWKQRREGGSVKSAGGGDPERPKDVAMRLLWTMSGWGPDAAGGNGCGPVVGVFGWSVGRGRQSR